MQYLKTFESFNNKNMEKINEWNVLSQERKQKKLELVREELDEMFPNENLYAYFITKNPNEINISIYIKDLSFIPYNEEYKEKIRKFEHIPLSMEDNSYNKKFTDMITEIKYIVNTYELGFFDFKLSPFLKDKLENKIKSPN